MKKAILLILAVVMVCCLLTGCATKVEDADYATTKLKEAGFEVTVMEKGTELNTLAIENYLVLDGVTTFVIGEKEDGELCAIAYCDEYSHPNKVEDSLMKAVEAAHGEDSEIIVKKCGFTIFAGTQETLDMMQG